MTYYLKFRKSYKDSIKLSFVPIVYILLSLNFYSLSLSMCVWIFSELFKWKLEIKYLCYHGYVRCLFLKNKDVLLITITLKIKIDSNIILLFNPETIFHDLYVVSVILFIAVIFSGPESNARTHAASRCSLSLVCITLKEPHGFSLLNLTFVKSRGVTARSFSIFLLDVLASIKYTSMLVCNSVWTFWTMVSWIS